MITRSTRPAQNAVSSAIHTQPKEQYYKSDISQKSDGDVSLHSGSQVNLNLKVQLDANLERAVLLLGVAVVVQIRALDHCFADLVGGHRFDLFIGLLRHVFEVLSAAQRRAGWVVEESAGGLSAGY